VIAGNWRCDIMDLGSRIMCASVATDVIRNCGIVLRVQHVLGGTKRGCSKGVFPNSPVDGDANKIVKILSSNVL